MINKVEDSQHYLMGYPGKIIDICINAANVENAPQFRKGDHVMVTGPVNDTLFTHREIEAERIASVK